MKPDWIPFAFLPVFKSVGPTSHDIVASIRRLLPRKVKVGHTGTLDPFASGVLILALGKATRFSDDIHKLPKSYSATIKLGEETDTLDPTGTVVQASHFTAPTQEQLDAVSARFLGVNQQIPPAFSAKKVKGKKSYELARENKAVPLPPREIHIHRLELKPGETGDLVQLNVNCSTGTYVRALARDIAEALGTCGHLVALERTSVGGIDRSACIVDSELTEELVRGHSLTVSTILPQYPEIQLPDVALALLEQGRPFPTFEKLPGHFLGYLKDREHQTVAVFRCEYDEADRQVSSRQLCYRRVAERVG